MGIDTGWWPTGDLDFCSDLREYNPAFHLRKYCQELYPNILLSECRSLRHSELGIPSLGLLMENLDRLWVPS